MNRKVVIVKGIAGLGNRLRTVTAAMQYAESTGRGIYVDWKDGMFAEEGVNAFGKYFQLIDFPSIDDSVQLCSKTFYPEIYEKLDKDKGIYYYFEKKQLENRFVRKGFQYFFKIMNTMSSLFPKLGLDKLEYNLSMKYQCFVLKPEYQKVFGCLGQFGFGEHLTTNIDADAVIFVDNIPFYKPEIMKKHIKLQPWIQNEIDTFVKSNKLEQHSVGVHVRATGKKCYGDLNKFIAKLKTFMPEHGIKKVFLCTDTKDIEEIFKNEFGEAVVMYPKYLPKVEKAGFGIHQYARDSKDAELQDRLTKEAVVDMFALAQTEYLFYHFGSTFSEISRVYHKEHSKCSNWLSL